jgi:hypothetical protein
MVRRIRALQRVFLPAREVEFQHDFVRMFDPDTSSKAEWTVGHPVECGKIGFARRRGESRVPPFCRVLGFFVFRSDPVAKSASHTFRGAYGTYICWGDMVARSEVIWLNRKGQSDGSTRLIVVMRIIGTIALVKLDLSFGDEQRLILRILQLCIH